VRLVWGSVTDAAPESYGVLRLTVTLDGETTPVPAVAYPALTGRVLTGDRVLCNTTAIDRDLGTGGEHFVVARAGAGESLVTTVAGHIMKLRYTPLQHDVTVVEESASGHHPVMADVTSLDGLPVVCCGLHSQVPLVAAAVREVRPGSRIVYVMTDQAALPMAVSRLVPAMLEAGLIDETITVGQAFGGGLEAVNLHSGLLAACHVLRADCAIVSIGPGIVGTATPYGHGGVAQGEAINAVAALGGRSVAVLRISFADPRPRHVPVSHQSLTALTGVALAPAIVAVPSLPIEEAVAVDRALTDAGVWRVHERGDVPDAPLPDVRGIDVRSMGRAPTDDPAFFLAAAAAGRIAGSLPSVSLPTLPNRSSD